MEEGHKASKMKATIAYIFPQHKSMNYPEQDYLFGLRGLLTIETFLWVFLQTFVPAAVKDSNNPDGPTYQTILRKTLSVLLWNENQLYSFIILLSARCICLPFIKTCSRTTIASALLRRGLRLALPVAVSLAIAMGIFAAKGLTYIDDFKTNTGNVSFSTPYQLPNALAYFNSVFNLFWATQNFANNAGSLAFPSQTLWIITVLYTQSYTVYITMVIIPYTRATWRLRGFISFIIAAWWVQSWAWYSITGLLLADIVTNMDFQSKSQRGIKVFQSIRCPSWIVYGTIMAAGILMQYIYIAYKPTLENKELGIHTALYYSGGLNENYNINQPQARDDNYLFILGFLLLLETSSTLQTFFKNPLFMYLGYRSISEFILLVDSSLFIPLFLSGTYELPA
jgi:hypothetical protein